jgi:hypothetical protein
MFLSIYWISLAQGPAAAKYVMLVYILCGSLQESSQEGKGENDN